MTKVCKYCGLHINGEEKMARHMRDHHPKEDLQEAIEKARRDIERLKEDIKRYEARLS